MIKTSLTPGLMAIVAITVPLANSVRANAQETVSVAPQTTEVLKAETNTNISQPSALLPVAVVVESESNRFSPLIKVLNRKKDKTALSVSSSVIVPTLEETPKPPVNQLSASDLNPASIKIPKPAPISMDDKVAVVMPKYQIFPITAQALQTEPSSENPNSPEPTPAINPETSPNSEAPEARVLVSEVVVKSDKGESVSNLDEKVNLETEVYNAIRTQAGQITTRSQLQEDINAIFRTGYFSNVQASPEDTPLGVRVSFVVTPNPKLSKVEIEANPGTGVASVLPSNTAEEIFKTQYGQILNLRTLQEGIKELNKRYQDQGYVLANLIGSPKIGENGVVTLQIVEGVVENVKVQFRSKDGQDVNDKGEPIRGRTKDYIVTREVELKPGQVFNRNIVQKDLQRVFGLGLFEDVNVSLDPGTDPSKVNVVINVAERSSGSIAAGAGISSSSGLFGTVSYQQQNLGGRNQKLGTEVQLGERELLFDLRFTDPWIGGDPYRTSYTANIFRRRSISLIYEGKDKNIETFDPNNTTNVDQQDRPRVTRLGGGITFSRPLSANPFKESKWFASLGLLYQRISGRDADGNLRKEGAIFDDNGKRLSDTTPLTFSSSGEDDLLLLKLGAQRDLRNNSLQPTQGSYLSFGIDQSVPIGSGSILMTRLRGNYSYYLPVKFTGFSKKPETLAFNIQGGTILGDLPPYEAFTLGGSNSVRGYDEGRLGTGSSYLQAAVEYRFPVFSVVSGALFFDYGSDLGTSTKAAQLLNKNGNGYSYGLGLRIQSPLGPIRIDYGITDDGDSRINFGIGERF